MAGERKPVTIHFRKLDRIDTNIPEGLTLENAIKAAMNFEVDGKALRRRYLSRTYSSGGDNFFINTYAEKTADDVPIAFGDILHFTKGHLQALCKTADQNAESVPVQQMKAPEQSEYVHSQMFWMVKDDNVFIIQSLSLDTETFETYLSWLLRLKSKVFPTKAEVVLTTKFDEALVGSDLSEIKELVVGGVVSAAPAPMVLPEDGVRSTDAEPSAQDVVESRNVDAIGSTGWSQAREILSSLMQGTANVDRLLAKVPRDAELSVKVHIGFKTKRRSIDRASLRQLERGLRNLPDTQLQVVAKGATKAADGMIRLHHKASVQLMKVRDGESQIMGSLLDPNDVRRAMMDAYTKLKASGKIT